MTERPPEPEPAVGLRRFHKLTISVATGLLLVLTLHYFRAYSRSEELRHLIYCGVTLVGASGLLVYLRAFSRSKGLG